MQLHQTPAPVRPFPEIFIERDSRELALEVDLVLRPVGRVVQDGVHVVENILLGNLFVFVVLLELAERPAGDVLDALKT